MAKCRVDHQAASPSRQSDLSLLGDFKGVVHLDAKVSHRRLKFGMAKQQLHGAQVFCAPLDQRRLGSPQRERPPKALLKPEHCMSTMA